MHPGSGAEFDLLFRQSYRNDKLSYFKIPGTPHGIAIDPNEILVGRAVRIASGDNLTIIVTGAQLASAVGANERLKQTRWRADILYVHTITPLDIPTIRESVARTGRVIVVEEHMRNGGSETAFCRVFMICSQSSPRSQSPIGSFRNTALIKSTAKLLVLLARVFFRPSKMRSEPHEQTKQHLSAQTGQDEGARQTAPSMSIPTSEHYVCRIPRPV